ncbi:hypothetical protein BASA83_013484 [Batrachochytrium salamandrivorans]|nr:hypothetical protein BASA83_013484 [Batrachochytrium salamandrivorans]
MPFGLANAPAQFQRMMNALFRDVVGKHVLVYLDDIVIYSDTMDKHVKQVQSVLGVLRDNGLYCKAEKCHFYQTEIKYLGYIISSNGIRMDPSKISAVQEWPTPRKARWSLELSEYDFTLTPPSRKAQWKSRSTPLVVTIICLKTTYPTFQRILDPKKVIDLQALMVDHGLGTCWFTAWVLQKGPLSWNPTVPLIICGLLGWRRS